MSRYGRLPSETTELVSLRLLGAETSTFGLVNSCIKQLFWLSLHAALKTFYLTCLPGTGCVKMEANVDCDIKYTTISMIKPNLTAC